MPTGYAADRTARWPLLIFLHGSGERGDDLATVKVHGPPKIADRDPAFPFVLVSPQLPSNEDWDVARLDALLDRYAQDRCGSIGRAFISTGLSLGGHATWRWAAAEPWRFAAIAPVAGRGDTCHRLRAEDVCRCGRSTATATTPFTPEGSFAMVRAIRACGGAPRLTIYPDLGHNSWDPAYDDPALYWWLLKQRLGPAPNKDKE